MAPLHPPSTNPRSRTAIRSRWVLLWLATGMAIALLLLTNAIRDYHFVARLLTVQQTRHQITQLSAHIEQQLRRTGVAPAALADSLSTATVRPAWIDLRKPDGRSLQHWGDASPSLFTVEQEHAHFAHREPLFQTLSTSAGVTVVEALPLHLPPPFAPGNTHPLALPGPDLPLTLEIALPLSRADPSVLAPIRRNLVINSTASLALLATALIALLGFRSYVAGKRLEQQVEIARQVQTELLPPAALHLPGIELATEYTPAEQIGGDFYDLFRGDNSAIALILGDVSGKGIPAALLMGVIHGAVRTSRWQLDTAAHEAESTRLNRLLCEHASTSRFASMVWCSYNPSLRSLRYVNAGHCPPLLLGLRAGTLHTSRLDQGGPVLGLLPDALYQQATVDIYPGDLLVLYSDGVIEAANPAREEFGEDRLLTLLQSHLDDSPAHIRASLLASLAGFLDGRVAQDDLSFVIARF